MIKSGIGYDAHQLGEGESLVIGGVKIESNVGSIGHSDGDVLIHAIIDAILGATASGDIGLLFPSDSIKYKNFHSGDFLKIVKKEILNKNHKILHIDSVVILQSPKLRSYIDQMRTNISNMLELKLNQVSIKATTTDFLGYIGRGEGLAAQSIVTIENNDNRLWYLNLMLK